MEICGRRCLWHRIPIPLLSAADIIGVCDQASRYVKPAQGRMTKRALIRRCFLNLASHREFTGWNKNHHSPKSVCEIAETRMFQVGVALNFFGRGLLLDWSRRCR